LCLIHLADRYLIL